MWISRRGIRASRPQMKVDISRLRGCDILLVETTDLVYLGLRGCCNTMDDCVMDVAKRSRKLKGIDCRKMTDAGVTALSHGCGRCGQPQSINLRGCTTVTDASVTALNHECGQLQSTNLWRCSEVTDAGVTALSYGCGQPQRIRLWGCRKVTNAGVTA